jgi:hypothetical protein
MMMAAILALALTLTVIFGYLLVESALALAGENTPAKAVVALAAVLTGFVIPWALVTGLLSVAGVEPE